MIANYHTHTWRCKHATGTEEEYVQAAIRRGLKRLGFADHSPYCFPEGYYSTFRMKPEDTAVYANDIFTLRDRYRDAIDIRLGVEIEYYPAFFADTVSMLRDNQVEYLILGQHFLDNEMGGSVYSGIPSANAGDLQKYCRQIMDACNTGLVTYIAHPDLFHYNGDTEAYQRPMREMCREARACGVPLELNLLGVAEGRHYPCEIFWEVAAEEGCKVILGCDAHSPDALLDVDSEKRALEMAKKWGMEVLEDVPLRRL